MRIIKQLSILTCVLFSISSIKTVEADKEEEHSDTKPFLLTAEYLSDIQKQLVEQEDPDLISIYFEKTNDIRFPEEGSLAWKTGKILEIQTAGNIIFPAKFSIRYSGKGGGLILKPYDTKETKGGSIIGSLIVCVVGVKKGSYNGTKIIAK